MKESSLMNKSMTNTVKNIIVYKYKNYRCDRAEYINDCLKESFSSMLVLYHL